MADGLRFAPTRYAWCVALVGVLCACARTPAPSVEPPSAIRSPAPSAWPFWQAPAFTLRESARPLLLSEEVREPRWLESDEVWRTVARRIFEKTRSQGIAIHRTSQIELNVGDFYEERIRRGAPVLITIDALTLFAHVALASAFVEIESRIERADLLAMLRRVDGRLSAEAERASPDLVGGYRLARSTVAVALVLADPAHVVPADLEDAVSLEVARIRAHEGLARSPLFDADVDYGAMSPRGDISSFPDDPGTPFFRAAEWLAQAPFLLEASGELGGAPIDVGTARTHTRAALLVARLLAPEGDAIAAVARARIDRIALFAVGGPDDLSPVDLAQMARSSGSDPRWGSDIADTAKLDHVRHASSRLPALFDGSGSARQGADGGAPLRRPPRSMRIVPLRGTPDSFVIERCAFSFPGATSAPDASLERRPTLPSMPIGLSVAAWLESGAAKRSLASLEHPGDAGFDVGLSCADLPHDEISHHGSIYISGLESIAAWLRPSAAERPESPVAARARDRRKLETALVAWTLLRHEMLPFAHRSGRPLSPAPAMLVTPDERRGQVLIEPHPEAIADLLGLLRQARTGFSELGVLASDSRSVSLFEEIESLLSLSLEAAARAANRASTYSELSPDLAQIPARMVALERFAGSAAEPVVIDVHLDIRSALVVEEGTGSLDELFVRVEDPIAQRQVLAVGASIPHFEFMQQAGERLSDAAWRVKSRGEGRPNRDAFTAEDLVATE